MGAFDTYAAQVRCPGCGDVHHLSGQTKFFDPDFAGHYLRCFRPGLTQPIDFDPARLTTEGVWEWEWLRVREVAAPGRLRLLVDFDDMFTCGCGRPVAPVLDFEVAGDASGGRVTLTSVELHDVSADELAVDFAEGPPGVRLAELAAAPEDVREARLRACLAERFAWAHEPAPPWTHVEGPAPCEACSAARLRRFFTLLTHPDCPGFFGPGWTGGLIRVGEQVACDPAWLAEDRDRDYWVRVRHPVAEDSLTLLARPCHWGCGCAAGRASPVLRFARSPEGLRLAGLSLRVVRGADDLAGVDLVEAPHQSRDAPKTPWQRHVPATREEAIAALLYEFVGPR